MEPLELLCFNHSNNDEAILKGSGKYLIDAAAFRLSIILAPNLLSTICQLKKCEERWQTNVECTWITFFSVRFGPNKN